MKLVIEQTKEINLLYVEDNESLRISTLKVLQNFFTTIDSAEDGLVGLNKYKESLKNNAPYDLIISDINMPNLTGIEMAEDIIKLNPLQSIIFVTAHNEIEFLQKAIRLGVSSFITKPIQLQDLALVLFKVCRSINDKKFVESYYGSMESRNLELENKIKELESELQKLKNNESNIELDQIELISNEDQMDLNDLKEVIESEIISLSQMGNDTKNIQNLLVNLSFNIDKSIKIFEYYHFLNDLNQELTTLSLNLENSYEIFENSKDKITNDLNNFSKALIDFINILKYEDKKDIATLLSTLVNVTKYLNQTLTLECV